VVRLERFKGIPHLRLAETKGSFVQRGLGGGGPIHQSPRQVPPRHTTSEARA
jgi:hypothetical protein